MKKNFYLAALALLMFTCKDQQEIDKHASMLNERVGSQIQLETAKRWTERFTKSNSEAREKSEEAIESSYLYDYLTDIESKVGIGFHYGLDINDEVHVLIIAYDYELKWDESVFDTRTKAIISKANAHQLCDRYKLANSSGPWSHFLGRDIISTILEKPNFNSFQLIPGINDENEKQLLLYVWLTEEISNGRTLQEGVEVYDKSALCPAVCPSE